MVKGLVSPITNMFSSVRNFAAGAGIIAGGAVLTAATGGAIAPLFVIAGVGMGAAQLVKAGCKIAKAKNGDDVEKAFYDIGGAASTIGLSAAGAKNALKQANISTKGLNVKLSLKNCFTSAKSLINESISVIKSGYYKINLKTAFNNIKNPQSLRKYSAELAAESKKEFKHSFDALKEVLPEEVKPSLKGRAKCQISIYEKMTKSRNSLIKQIKEIKADKTLSQAEKNNVINSLKQKIRDIDTHAETAKSVVGDNYGARITDVSPKNIKKVVSSLEQAAKEGKIEILEVENYRGSNKNFALKNDFYFSDSQINRLSKVTKNANVRNCDKNSGYTAVHMKIKPKNAQTLELQIRGKEINSVADWEHVPYDLRQSKDIAKGNNKVGKILSPIKKAVKNMTKEQNIQYQKYIYENYMYAQAKELGKNVPQPKLPKGIDPLLSAENMAKLHKQTSGAIASDVRNPYNIKHQLAATASVESNLKKNA